MIGGSGEKKTLRLVARYADICNVRMDTPDGVKRRFEILAQHCEAEGRDYNSIERTVVTRFDPKADGSGVEEMVDTFGKFAEAGVQGALGYLIGCEDPKVMDVMASRAIPQLRAL